MILPPMAARIFIVLRLIIGVYCYTSVFERQNNRYVKLPVVHSTNRNVFADIWDNKRAITTVPLANRSDVAYYAKLDIGTPPQEVYVQLDTGSFELWVNPDCSNLEGSADVRFCKAVGHYNPSTSSTAAKLTGTKVLRYGIGSANIQYVTDDIGLSGTDARLEGVQFGVATGTVDEFSGILGIGHGDNVAISYKNFVDQLADKGVTDTKAFSLALGSKDEQEGVVIFGGLDTGKFTGTLETLPIIPAKESPDQVPRYWVNMTSLGLNPPSGKKKQYTNTTLAVFLDSGATLTLLPTALANSIAADFGAKAMDANGFYPVDCALNNLPGTVDFAFGNVTIQVPYNEFIRELPTGFGTQCFLGISPNEDFVLLGDTMLRSAYAVFDQTNDAIHLAQYVNCGMKEIEITSKTSFASIKGDCNPPALKPTAAPSSSSSVPTTTVTASDGSLTASETNSADAESASVRLTTYCGWVGLWTGLISATFAIGVVV